jgi:hypothetical protein
MLVVIDVVVIGNGGELAKIGVQLDGGRAVDKGLLPQITAPVLSAPPFARVVHLLPSKYQFTPRLIHAAVPQKPVQPQIPPLSGGAGLGSLGSPAI